MFKGNSLIRIHWCNSLPKIYKKLVQTWTCVKRYKVWWMNHLKKRFVLFQANGSINLISMLRILENCKKQLEISLKIRWNFKKKKYMKKVVNSQVMNMPTKNKRNFSPFMTIQCLKSLAQFVILIWFIYHPIIRIRCIKSLTQISIISKKEI